MERRQAMPTDDERRDVARRLRESAGTAPYMNTSDDFAREVFRAAMNESVGDYRAAVDRLADLIEPDHVGDSNKMVDRDALLALADEMEGDARYWLDRPYDQLGSHDVIGYACRIREALGDKL